MRVSKQLTTAILVLLLCEEYKESDVKITSKFLSEKIMESNEEADQVLIRQIMTGLKRSNIIESQLGSGGITLCRPLNEISIYDVFDAIEGSRLLMSFYSDAPARIVIEDCLQSHFDAYLGNMKKESLNDLYKKYKKNSLKK